jgi:uncharacterized lipoprotein
MASVRLIAAGAAALAVFALSGCSNAEEEAAETLDAAYSACQTGVTPQFRTPASVVWPDESDESSVDGSTFTFTVTVQAADAKEKVVDYVVTCTVEQSGTAWMLDSYSITAG